MLGILSTLRRSLHRTRDREYLESMSDAMLKDIGKIWGGGGTL